MKVYSTNILKLSDGLWISYAILWLSMFKDIWILSCQAAQKNMLSTQVCLSGGDESNTLNFLSNV